VTIDDAWLVDMCIVDLYGLIALKSLHVRTNEADTARNAKTVAELASGRDKIIATEGIPGKVIYWNGRGEDDWTRNTDCEAMFKNTIVWMITTHDIAIYNVTAFPSQVKVGQPVSINVTIANEGNTPENVTVRVYYENLTQATAFSTSIPSEPHQANAMWIEPSFKDLTHYMVGQRFNVTVWLNLTQPSYAWQIYLVYNGTILNATGCGYTAGNQSQFFKGLPTIPLGPKFGQDPSGNAYVIFAETLLGEAERRPGYGSLCWIEFEIINKPLGPYTGYLVLDPVDTCVIDPEWEEIPITLYSGVYSFGVSPPTPPTLPGLIGEQTVYLLSGENMTLTFTWNTTNVARKL
jgi:hypothetical protein